MILAPTWNTYKRPAVHNSFSLTKILATTQILGEPCNLGVHAGFRARLLIEKNTNHLNRHPFGAVEVVPEPLHAYLQTWTHFITDSYNLRKTVHLLTPRTTGSRFMRKAKNLPNGSSLKVQQLVRNKRWIQCSVYGTMRKLTLSQSIWGSKMELPIVKFTKNQNTNHNSEAKRKTTKFQILQSYRLTWCEFYREMKIIEVQF